ncbi:hypothetical protein F4782DRAFT_534567 [Xylaria castorea]|nr:hypothetical protein F4782DRAFT_534567 [Xylaria castorea]
MLMSTEFIWAPPKQSSYIAATTFQEHFARFRRQMGFLASTIAYSLVSNANSDFKQSSLGTHDIYVRNRALTTTEWNVLATIEPAFLDPATAAEAVVQQPSASLITRAMKDSLASIEAGNGDGEGTNGAASACSPVRLRHAYDEAIKADSERRNDAIELVTHDIVAVIAKMLFIDIINVDPAKSVADHGMDSLIAAELRHWFHQALGGTNLKWWTS